MSKWCNSKAVLIELLDMERNPPRVSTKKNKSNTVWLLEAWLWRHKPQVFAIQELDPYYECGRGESSTQLPTAEERLQYARLCLKAETGSWTNWDMLKVAESDSYHSKWFAVTRASDQELRIPESLQYIYDKAKRQRVQSLLAFLLPVEVYALQCAEHTQSPYQRSKP